MEATRSIGTWRRGPVVALVGRLRRWLSTLPTSTPSWLTTSLDSQAWCAEHRDELARVSYVVREEPTATGKDLWLDVTVENRSGRDIGGYRSGRLRVADAVPGERDRMTYGGGTGEEYFLGPHERFVWQFSVNEPFHALPTGRFVDVRLGISAVVIPPSGIFDDAQIGCDYPILPAGRTQA